MTGPTSMPIDHCSVPRIFRSATDSSSRRSNNLYNPSLYLDSYSNGQQPASEEPAITWPTNYSLQSRNADTPAASAAPIDRFQTEPDTSWTTYQIAQQPRSSSGAVRTQQKLGQRSASNKRFLPGPGSDLVSRTTETDEGYYTTSQPDTQSVHSMHTSSMNRERHDPQRRPMVTSSPYHQPGSGNTAFEQSDSDIQHDQINANHAVQSQQGPNSLVCGHEDCNHESRTQSEFKYVSPR